MWCKMIVLLISMGIGGAGGIQKVDKISPKHQVRSGKHVNTASLAQKTMPEAREASSKANIKEPTSTPSLYFHQKRKIKGTSSKQTYLSESFESTGFPPAGWTTEIVSGSYDWEKHYGTKHPQGYPAYDGDSLADYPSYSAYSGYNARLITDTIDLGSATAPQLSFAMFHDDDYSSSDDSLVVEIKAKTGGSWPDSWTRLTKYLRYSSAGDAWSVHTIDLSSYAGDTVILSFHAYSGYGNDIHIDDIKIQEALANDIGAIEVFKPGCAPYDSSKADSIGVVITNFATNSQSNFYVIYDFKNDPGRDSILYTGTLASGDTDTVYIDWTPNSTGDDTIFAWTNLSGDEDNSNDTASLAIHIYEAGVLLTEGFEGDFPPPCWDTSGTHWSKSSYYHHSGNYSAYCSRYATDEYLETYEMDISSGGPYNKLEFYWYNSSSGTEDSVFVEVWNGSDWDTLDCLQPGTGSWEYELYALSSYSNSDFKVRWRYVGPGTYDAYSFYLDDVMIANMPLHDIGVDSIPTPKDTVASGSDVSPVAWVHNYGDFTENFDVIMYITHGTDTVYSDTQQVTNLASGAEQAVTFDPYNFSGHRKRYKLTAISTLSDNNADNDTLMDTTIVYAHQGNDSYGWHWKDVTGGATYNWIELFNNTAGADSIDTLWLGDDGKQLVHLPNPTKFYGYVTDSMWVGSNGGIDFTKDDISFSNEELPTSKQEKFLAVFWEDLKCADSQTDNGDSAVYVGYFGDTLVVVEWYQVPRYNYPDQCFTFEALIYTKDERNDIIFQYKDMSGYDIDDENATIGIQDSAASEENGNYICYTYDEMPYTPNWSEKAGQAIVFINPEATNVHEQPSSRVTPRRFQFLSPYPNPTTGIVNLTFAIPQRTQVKVAVYNVAGQKVKTLINKVVNAGYLRIRWDGTSETGKRVRAGVYFVRFESSNYTATKKIVITK